MTLPFSTSIPQRIWFILSRLDAHHRLFVSTGIAAVKAGRLPAQWASPTRLLAIWLVYSLLTTGHVRATILGVYPVRCAAAHRVKTQAGC